MNKSPVLIGWGVGSINPDVPVLLRGQTYERISTGTHDALLETASYVQTIEKRQGGLICCPEETAYRQGWIDQSTLLAQAEKFGKTYYGAVLKSLAEGELD